jgi:hypothetical protein
MDTYMMYDPLFTVHGQRTADIRHFNLLYIQADRACGSSAHGQTDSHLLLLLPRKFVNVEDKYVLLREEVRFDGYIKSSASRSTLHTYERVYK